MGDSYSRIDSLLVFNAKCQERLSTWHLTSYFIGMLRKQPRFEINWWPNCILYIIEKEASLWLKQRPWVSGIKKWWQTCTCGTFGCLLMDAGPIMWITGNHCYDHSKNNQCNSCKTIIELCESTSAVAANMQENSIIRKRYIVLFFMGGLWANIWETENKRQLQWQQTGQQ